LAVALAGGVVGTMQAEAPGALDPAFNGSGRAYAAFDRGGLWRDTAYDLLVEPDGHVVVVGRVEGTLQGDFDLGIARFRPDGTLDTAWGELGGRTVVSLGGTDEAASAVAIDGFGRYLVAGWTGGASGTDFVVVRLDEQGHRDFSWGPDGGKVLQDMDQDPPNHPFDFATAIEMLPSGGILVGGTASADDVYGNEAEPALLRLHADGTRDPFFAFYPGGQCWPSWYPAESFLVDDIALQPDGKILLVGYLRINLDNEFSIAIKRVDAGCLDDHAFRNFYGQLKIDFEPGSAPELGHAVALQADGRIVIVGSAYRTFSGDDDIAIVRLEPDGDFDTSFGGLGVGWMTLALDLGGGDDDRGYATAVQGDGKIVLAARAATAAGEDFAVYRLLPDGAPDAGFGLFGFSLVNFAGGGPNHDGPYGLALAPDGRIVVAGDATRSASGDLDFAVARLQNDYVFADAFESGGTGAWSRP